MVIHGVSNLNNSFYKAFHTLLKLLQNYLRGKTCEVYSTPFDVRLNLKIQYDFKNIQGSQFAELKWYYPGRKQ